MHLLSRVISKSTILPSLFYFISIMLGEEGGGGSVVNEFHNLEEGALLMLNLCKSR